MRPSGRVFANWKPSCHRRRIKQTTASSRESYRLGVLRCLVPLFVS